MTIPTKLNRNAKSEFGEGLVICLVKFAEHAEAWFKRKEDWEKMRKRNPNLFIESDAVMMFFNGASDHLYGLKTPRGWSKEYPKVYKLVNNLRNFGLDIGHSFQEKEYSEKDIFYAYDLCRSIAMEIDKILGLKPDIGEY